MNLIESILKTIPVLILTICAGCNGNHSSADKHTDVINSHTDTVPNKVGAGLMDSIKDPSLREMVKDGAEIIEVEHKICFGHYVELITFINYNSEGNKNLLESRKASLANISKCPDCNLSDTAGTVDNPCRDLNDIYRVVSRYKGRIMFSGGMDGTMAPDKVLMDKIVYTFGEMEWCQHYKDARKDENGIVKYILSSYDQNSETLEIKNLKDKYSLQLWKWSSNNGGYYELRIRIENGIDLPTMNFWNNIGEAACASDSIPELPFFDQINYDSLMNSK